MITVQTSIIKYKAIDGEIFNSKEECAKYEDTAKCLINSKYKKLVVGTISEYGLINFGSDEAEIDYIKITKEQDIDVIIQKLCICNPYYLTEQAKESINKYRDLCLKALKNKDYILVNTGYQGDTFFFVGTFSSIIDNFKELKKKLNETD